MRTMRWPMVALGEVLALSLDPERVDPRETYPTLGVYGFGRGVITSKPPVQGSEIAATVLHRVHAGQFIYSKLKAFEGAFAVVPREGHGRFVTNEFPTFSARADSLDPQFLEWLFRVPSIWDALSADSVGIGARRERLHPNQLLAFQVPLPPLDEQRCIVARLGAVSSRLKARADAADRQEAELGVMLQQAFARITTGSPRARMADVAPLVRRPIEVEPDGQYQELGIRSFGRGPFHKPSLSGLDAGSKRLFRIEPCDLVFNIVFAWEGAVAIARPEDAGRVGSHRFLTCVADQTRVSAEVLRFWFLSREGLAALGQASPGGAGRNRTLGLDALSRIEVPIPSLDAQAWFEALHARAASLRALNAAAAGDAAALLPAMLHQTFSPAAC